MKPSVSRTFTTTAPPDVVSDYLADFRNTEEWDPGTRTCERTSGDGGIGTTYRNISSFLGREVELTYTTVELVPRSLVHLQGHNDRFEGHDVFAIREAPGGSEVTYSAKFSFSGLARVGVPAVSAYLPFLASKTVDQLKACLDRRAS